MSLTFLDRQWINAQIEAMSSTLTRKFKTNEVVQTVEAVNENVVIARVPLIMSEWIMSSTSGYSAPTDPAHSGTPTKIDLTKVASNLGYTDDVQYRFYAVVRQVDAIATSKSITISVNNITTYNPSLLAATVRAVGYNDGGHDPRNVLWSSSFTPVSGVCEYDVYYATTGGSDAGWYLEQAEIQIFGKS